MNTSDTKTANTNDESRLDIIARGFWEYGQTAFFDIKVTHANAQSNQNSSTKEIFRKHENAKKREYNERILEVEHGSFTPLVFLVRMEAWATNVQFS